MLPKRSRLPREAFLASFKGAFRVRGLGFQVLYTPSPDFKAAIVVSKKVEATAVGRNQIRRRLYGYFADLQKEKSFRGHFIVMVSPDIKKYPSPEVRSSLEVSCAGLLSRKAHPR